MPAPGGVLQRVTTLVVTDTFGIRTLIRPVEQLPTATGQPWSMFKVSAADGTLSDFILLPPQAGLVTDADPLEDVLFLRDNMAAMAWGVERELQGALDLAVDGYEQYLVRLNLNGPPATAPAPAGSPPIAYTLEQPVPDNWIPLVPVQTPEGALMFRRGTMEIPTASGLIKLQPHTSILDPGVPYFVTDRMITPARRDRAAVPTAHQDAGRFDAGVDRAAQRARPGQRLVRPAVRLPAGGARRRELNRGYPLPDS